MDYTPRDSENMKPAALVLLVVIIVLSIFNLLAGLGVIGKDDAPPEYMVMTTEDLDQLMIQVLQDEEGVTPDEEGKMSVPTEKMLSQNIMPKVMNRLGEKGWELCGINRNELYYFKRPAQKN